MRVHYDNNISYFCVTSKCLWFR